jgi:hypothetical protein
VIFTGLMMKTIKRQADIMDRQATDARKSGEGAAITAQGTLAAIQDQAAQMKQQVDMMEKSAQAAVDNATAAQTAAEAAKMSAKIAKDSLELIQRTYIQIVSMGLKLGNVPLPNGMPVTDNTQVTVTIKNHGPTRALDVSAKGTLAIVTGNKSTILAPQISLDLAPATDLGVSFDPFNEWLDADAIALLKQGVLGLQVSLQITCSDIFGKSHEFAIERYCTIGFNEDGIVRKFSAPSAKDARTRQIRTLPG